jgi:hypothetical protein
VIVAERLLQAFRELEACGACCTITAAVFTMSADEGRTAQKVYMSADDLLRTDAQDAAARRAKMCVVNGGRQ